LLPLPGETPDHEYQGVVSNDVALLQASVNKSIKAMCLPIHIDMRLKAYLIEQQNAISLPLS
jgi:hypothetical protein